MIKRNLVPATDWFFIIDADPPTTNEETVWRIALWAENEDGSVYGLISVKRGGRDDISNQAVASLVSVPPLKGVYKHLNDLTPRQLELSKKD